MSLTRTLIFGLSLAFVPNAMAQRCSYSEPSADFCTVPRVVSGDPGQHVVLMDASTATGELTFCNVSVGRTVWFQVNPTVSGPITISTCHPATLFDTLLQVWSGGDDECNLMTPVEPGCNDDTAAPECANGCSGAGSKVTFQGTAGTRYRFAVGAYNDNAANCLLCLGVIVTIGEPCGEAPTNILCETARPLPATPGVHEVSIDAEDALSANVPWSCSNPGVGRIAWFKFTSDIYGLTKFSTCHPTTTFDTVVQALQGGCGELMLVEACNDDAPGSECTNVCGTERGSTVSFVTRPGGDYFIAVGAYDNNNAGCGLCLGATLTIEDLCDVDTTPPIADMTLPADFSCNCEGVEIVGTADDPDGIFDHYELAYRPLNGGWVTLAMEPAAVTGGLLGVWTTTGLSEGFYVLRLKATNVCGRSSTAERVVRIDKQFDDLDLRRPGNGEVVGGQVCPDGTAWDQCFGHYTVMYRPAGAGTFRPVDALHQTYSATVIGEPLAEWNTALGVPDGDYALRVQGSTVCGAVDSRIHEVIVDNTAPVAVITSPTDCSSVHGSVQVRGTANDAHLAGWALYYTGGPAHGWVPISAGTGPVINGSLGDWNTQGLPPCAYTLRLVVTDQAVVNCNGAVHNQSEYNVSVNLGSPLIFDADGDGDVDLDDYWAFLQAFTGP